MRELCDLGESTAVGPPFRDAVLVGLAAAVVGGAVLVRFLGFASSWEDCEGMFSLSSPFDIASLRNMLAGVGGVLSWKSSPFPFDTLIWLSGNIHGSQR